MVLYFIFSYCAAKTYLHDYCLRRSRRVQQKFGHVGGDWRLVDAVVKREVEVCCMGAGVHGLIDFYINRLFEHMIQILACRNRVSFLR